MLDILGSGASPVQFLQKQSGEQQQCGDSTCHGGGIPIFSGTRGILSWARKTSGRLDEKEKKEKRKEVKKYFFIPDVVQNTVINDKLRKT